MIRIFILITLALLFTLNAKSQTVFISGSAMDTLENKGIQNAVVALLSSKDSVLYKFTRTNPDGKYSFNNIQPGNYIIMTTHPFFADVLFSIEAKESEVMIPPIVLTSKSMLLTEVIVKGGVPIKIKGDTAVYTADSFKVRPGANVEDLLRKLPGIQVDRNGNITAMGERVKKVLVDGEEFFGDDPGIATKYLRADAVKEVQVFDKKSDQATFTGIDDGVKDKTINLKLKDDAKKGYFGKIEAGTDFNKYYNNSAMANAFKGKRKLAAYGIMSNTGQTNLDWSDNVNYGGNEGMEAIEGGVMYTWDDDDSYYNGRLGIPQNWNGGLHYSNKFNDDKQSLNSGYKISKVNSPSGERNYTTHFIGNSFYKSNSVADGFSTKLKHRLNLTYEINIDSANSLKLSARGDLRNTESNNNFDQESIDDKSLLLNTSSRKTNSTAKNSSLNSGLLWRHKFKKNARTLSVNLNYNLTNSNTDRYLFAENNYYNNGVLGNTDIIDQKNERDNNAYSFNSHITYTEPLAKDIFLSLDYMYSIANSSNDRISFSKDINHLYTNKIDALSNSFLFKQITNKPGISFRVTKKQYNYSIGAALSKNHFEQNNRTTSTLRKYNFTNFFPKASLYIKLKKNRNIRLNYDGSSKAPTLDQLQPVIDNTDPLNQYIGNPDLKQSFTHSMVVNYSFYNVLKESGLWSMIRGNITQNAFTNESTIDNSGKTIYRTVNANGNYNFWFYTNYYFKWKKPDLHISFGPTASAFRNISFVNAQKAINTNWEYGFSLGLRKDKENKYNFSIQPEISWVKANNSVNKNAAATYWQIDLNAHGEITLPYKFRLTSDVNFSAKQNDPRFPTRNRYTLWNASLKRSIFKEALEIGFSVNDILNENRGYDRSFSDYRYTETFYNTLRQYWLVTLTWNFSKNGAPVKSFH